MTNLTIRYCQGEIIQRSLKKEFLAPTPEAACDLMERSLDGVQENANNFGFELLATRILGAVPTHQMKNVSAHSNNEWKTEPTLPQSLAMDSRHQSNISSPKDSSKDASLITDVDGG
jgi:hypothetical protein